MVLQEVMEPVCCRACRTQQGEGFESTVVSRGGALQRQAVVDRRKGGAVEGRVQRLLRLR